jgi:hypothetical protein
LGEKEMAKSNRKRKKSRSGREYGRSGPGTMVFIGEQKMDRVCVDVIDYSENTSRTA